MNRKDTKNYTRLQLALDFIELADAIELARPIAEWIDIIEIGTPLIIREGVRAIAAMRQAFPGKALLADLKIADAGDGEARLAFDAGAELVTVLALAGDATIAGAVAAANRAGGEIMADLLQVHAPLARALELARLGVHYIGVHTASDDQHTGRDPLAELELLREAVPLPLFVAGGIGTHNIQRVATFQPAVIVVGSAITGADDPLAAARELRRQIQEAQGWR